ncbi:hypothetical protein LO762_25335 [Actinocorallia sp. API 0066]|uniref:hypothetical protein n=1 Tax=Actinocorallia sp. API 0066 TaxID=2896846 RepID=UPI001E6560D7|nr:hypothetical protein [Actinocorallia sp. API 0066]MCD0452482.1 hypothetical protein [Actinocorallia sp. API 0066]
MAQQHGIIVLVDVNNALKERSLDGNAYWFDNMKFLGSTGEGTEKLTTIVPGAYFLDGSQATEQVLNWLPAALGSVPPTVPRNYLAEQARHTDQEALQGIAELAPADEAELGRIREQAGRRARRSHSSRSLVTSKVLDATGQVAGANAADTYNYPTPVITDITGPAVTEKIIYPAQYGSPDMTYDGWYWAATVDTSRPGVYAYTMHIQLHELVSRDDELVWEPVDLTCESYLKVITDPKRNAFTGAGLGVLPLPAFPPIS